MALLMAAAQAAAMEVNAELAFVSASLSLQTSVCRPLQILSRASTVLAGCHTTPLHLLHVCSRAHARLIEGSS